MRGIVSFEFNPFQENTYVLYDDSKDCVIIDPGCYTEEERNRLVSFIEEQKLNPVKLLNTHCHIDHVLGNKFIAENYALKLEMHQGELPVLNSVGSYSEMMAIQYETSPAPGHFLEAGDVVEYGNTKLKVLFTPGHSPASICFYNEEEKYVICGDTLFQNSIGRYDLPGGNLNTLMTSINEQLMTLPEDVEAFPGHGPATFIGIEKKSNMFLIAYKNGQLA